MTASSPGPAPVTPGQRAYERRIEQVSARIGEAPEDYAPSWHDLPEDQRAEWEDAAQAAIGAAELTHDADLRAEGDEARADRDRYAEALQQIVDAVAAGDAAAVDKLARNALGLTRVGRPGPFRQPPPAPPGRSFEDMLADPNEQFDLRSDLLASIAEYAAAPQASASTCPSPQPAPGLAAALAETRKVRELLAEVLHEFDNGKGDGYRARVGQVKYNGWRERAGLGMKL